MKISIALATALGSLSSASSAEWLKAESKHFVIYGDMPVAEMTDYAKRLEKFDAVARFIRSQKDPAVGDGNRVHVFVVPTDLDVNRTLGGADAGVLGYYVDDVRSPYILTPHKVRRDRDNRTFEPEVVFFHEYTHHLQLQSSNRPLPAWLSEGFAEFLGNPQFNDDGSVTIGNLPKDRVQALVNGQFPTLATLMGGDARSLGYTGYWGANYVIGWLLNHYLVFEKSRKGQLENYVRRIGAGENAASAARASFGDLGALQSEINAYRSAKKFPVMKIDATKLTIPSVRVVPLSPAGSDIMMERIYAKTDYQAMTEGKVLERVRAAAARAPNDGLVMRTLAQVEYDNGNFAEAGKAADAALRAEPNSTEAMLYKGRSYLGQAVKSSDPNLFKEARSWFVKANKADPDDPEPLYLYYRSFLDANAPVPATAVEGLKYAAILAPRDLLLQVRLGMEYLRQKKIEEAKEALIPVAYMPHGVGDVKHAREAMDLIDKNQVAEALALLQKEVIPKEDPA